MKAIAALDLNSPQSRRALAFLVEHGTVIDPTLALFEFMTRSTAKPPVTFELGIAKIPPELAAILADVGPPSRSEEHTSELQSRLHLVCRLLLEKKKKQ